MNKLIIIFSALLLSSSLYSANNEFYIRKKPQWITPVEADTSQINQQTDKKDGATYLLVDNQINVATQESYNHNIIKINNEVGIQNYSDVWIDFEPSYQQLLFHELIIHRNHKIINKLKREDFKITQNETDLDRKMYCGNYTAGIYIKDIQVGDIIEYSYTTKGRNPIFKDYFFETIPLEYTVPIEHLYFEITYPQKDSIHYKLFNTESRPLKAQYNNKTHLIWDLRDIPEYLVDQSLPSWYIPTKRIQFSAFIKWKNVINWGIPLYPTQTITGTPLEKKFNELTKGLSSKDEKINALIHFVQNKIRYIGIEVNENSHKPHSPQEVLAKRFGDCKDKTYLLVTLLKHMDINASPAYVNTYLNDKVNVFLPSPTVFNHAVVAIEENGKTYIIDPTMTNQQGDYKSINNGNYKSALIINSHSKAPTKIKSNSVEKIIINEKYYTLSNDKKVSYDVETTYYGGQADQMRTSFNTRTTKELENSYLNFYDYLYHDMRLIDGIKSEDNKEQNIISIKEEYEIDDFWTYDENSNVKDYKATISPLNLRYYISDPDQRNRTMPFAIYHPIEVENNIELINNRKINIAPAKGVINNPCFQFSYDISQFGNIITFKYQYKSLKDFVSPKEFKQYYDDVDQIKNFTWREFTYGNSLDKSQSNNDFNILMFLLTIFFAIILVYIARDLNKKDKQIADCDTPLNIGGWLILPTIGILITPIILSRTIFTNGFFLQSSWDFISSRNSDAFNIVWSITFLFELLMNTLCLIYSVFLIVILIKRRTIFPVHFITFRFINLFVVVTDIILTSLINSEYFPSDSWNAKELMRAIVGTAIWVPYMLNSQRVKETFVKKYKSPHTHI